jgi:hypothetical protein
VPRKPLIDKGMQTSVRLPSELYKRLVKSKGDDRALGDEIRERLENSFSTEIVSADQKTQDDLINVVAEFAREIRSMNAKPWHEDAFSFAVLVSALDKVLKAMKPPGEPRPNQGPESLMPILYDPDVAPEMVAAGMAAPIISRLRRAEEKP